MYTLTFKLKKVVGVSVILLLFCSICITVRAATWGNFQTSSSSGQAALPSDSQDEIDAGEDEYDTAPISFRILGADRLDATEAAAQSGVLFFSSVYPIASECLDYFLSIPTSERRRCKRKDGGNNLLNSMWYNSRNGSSSNQFRASSSTFNLGKALVSHRGLYHTQKSVRTYVKTQIKARAAP